MQFSVFDLTQAVTGHSHADVYEHLFDQVKIAEDGGLDTYYITEHHFDPGYNLTPSPNLILAALNFAAIMVEVHARLGSRARHVLEGRIRDSLKAETGFAPLYLELDLARRLMDAGYDVEFPDMEGSARYDLLFSRDGFAGEVECKSLSADAGRQIHRKDFYRFMEAIAPALSRQAELKRREVLLITLDARLPSNTSERTLLVKEVSSLLRGAR